MEKIKKLLILFGFAIFAIVIVAVGYKYLSMNATHELISVTVSPKWVNQAQFAGIFVAQDKGMYANNGLNVIVKEFSFNELPLESLLKGASDFVYMSSQEYLKAYSDSKPIIAVAAFYQISPFLVASLASKQITSPSGLKGKVLGIKGGPGAEGESIYDILLNAAGLSLKDVTTKYIPFGTSELQDLQSDKADAIGFYRTDQLYEFKQEGIEYSSIYPEQYATGIYNDVLVVTKKFVNEHPDRVRAFIVGTQEGWAYAFDHRSEAIKIVLPYVTNSVYKDPVKERFILDQSEALMRPTPQTIVGSMDTLHWQRLYGILQSRKYLSRSFDINDAFTTNYLK